MAIMRMPVLLVDGFFCKRWTKNFATGDLCRSLEEMDDRVIDMATKRSALAFLDG
jgi:hypothetical protein